MKVWVAPPGGCICDSFLVRYIFFFFQAEDGIRDVERSRGLGDVYKRQCHYLPKESNKYYDSISLARKIDRYNDECLLYYYKDTEGKPEIFLPLLDDSLKFAEDLLKKKKKKKKKKNYLRVPLLQKKKKNKPKQTNQKPQKQHNTKNKKNQEKTQLKHNTQEEKN
eukprot:TRINITY_DN41258_c0_g1_i1.p1 TRINITY_DN41258_c0_g1~~TRINITY_DN41258_c0_g1_i1.p1  ORF type:complete len:165 (-),score=46.66 TRINITY_DN41258_c0_g1_i1:22-516(-)